MVEPSIYTIDDLILATGLSRRTVRFYVQRGLIPPPAGRGRGRHYGAEHLAGLLRIQELKRAGKKLDDIKDEAPQSRGRANGKPASPEKSPRRQVTRFLLAKEGLWLEVEPGATRPSPATLARLIDLCRRELDLVAGCQQRRITVLNRLGSFLAIPNGLKDGRPLNLRPGEQVEIDEVTPAITSAETAGMITVVKT